MFFLSTKNRVKGYMSKSMKKSVKKQKGIALLDLTIAVAIIAVLTYFGISKVQDIMSSSKVSRVVDGLSITIANIQKTYAYRPSLSGLTTATVADLKLIDSAFIDDAQSTISAPWNDGVINFEAVNSNRHGQVTLTNVPSRECSKIATQAFSSDTYLTAAINGANVKTGALGLVNLQLAGTECKSSEANEITMTFNKS